MGLATDLKKKGRNNVRMSKLSQIETIIKKWVMRKSAKDKACLARKNSLDELVRQMIH